MKRTLFETVKAQPYTSGEAVNREGFLSAVLGVKVGTAGKLTLTVTHSDDGTTFEDVNDELVFPEARTQGGVYEIDELAKDDILDIDIDLLGLKNFVKIAASGAAAANSTLVLVIGDADRHPV